MVDLEWRDLRLDPRNPRLPETLIGSDRGTLAHHYVVNETADELVDSMKVNGYFKHEPLLVRDDGEGIYTVLEGNRRFTAVLLCQLGSALGQESYGPPASDEVRRKLARIPCVVVDEAAVRSLIGFRHIGGLKKWKPEAKARFILAEVQAAVDNNEENPFLAVAKEVGSNSVGIRGSYLAFRSLAHGGQEFGVDVAHVRYDRFGVWQRALNSADVRRFIGLGDPKTYEQVEEALPQLDRNGFTQVISDLTPGDLSPAVLNDSRDVTLYGRILSNERALGNLCTAPRAGWSVDAGMGRLMRRSNLT